MQPTATIPQNGSALPQTPVNEYGLEGGLTVRDKTDGIAKVSLDREMTETHSKPVYRLTIHNKKLILPIASHPSDGEFLLANSRKITIKALESLFKISEVDAKGKNVFYVDTSNDVEGVAYDTYNYIPEEITEEEARKKFAHLLKENPNFAPDRAAYNRHGVCLFGINYSETDFAVDYAFYWANPSEERVRKITCSEITRYRDGGTSIAKGAGSDSFINFRYLVDGKRYFINGEPANAIKMGKY